MSAFWGKALASELAKAKDLHTFAVHGVKK
jgi:hypothetical protein